MADFPKIVLLQGKYFGKSTYYLTLLFADERRKVLSTLVEPILVAAEASYGYIKGNGVADEKRIANIN